MKKKIAIITAIAGCLLAMGTAAASAAPATPGRPATGLQFHIQNTGPGGCVKDQGVDNEFTVSTCATASNFYTVSDGGGYVLYEDNSNHCLEEYGTGSSVPVIAANCNPEALAQNWIQPNSSGDIYSEYDVVNSTGLYLTKGSVSPYYLEDNSGYGTAGSEHWELTCTAGCG